MSTITAAAVHLPWGRLARETFGGGTGTRAVASHDEDSTSLAVEAARALVPDGRRSRFDAVVFTTTTPGYADRTNAAAIHQALDLPTATAAYDMVGSVRSTVGALRAALDGARVGRVTLVASGDVRVGLPGSVDERDGGDGGAALVVGGDGPPMAELLGAGAATAEFLDRWRIPGALTSRQWEERFGEKAYGPLAAAAVDAALADAGLDATAIDYLIATGLHRRAALIGGRQAAGLITEVVDDLHGSIGTCGAAHPLVLLTDVLQRVEEGKVVALLTIADGADCLVFRTGPGVGTVSGRPVTAQLGGAPVDHQDVLVWRGLLHREPPRRPDPDRPAAPPSNRNREWKFGFVGSTCRDCGTRHLPPERVCLECRSVDHMDRVPLAGLAGTIATFAVDHLAFSLASPVVVAAVDLDGGGRLQCELTDVDATAVAVGDRVEMTFRRMYTTADGVHNYFWKARPVQEVR